MLGFFVKRFDRERSYPGADGLSTIIATASHAVFDRTREKAWLLPTSRDCTVTKKKSLSTLFCLILKRKEHHHDDRN